MTAKTLENIKRNLIVATKDISRNRGGARPSHLTRTWATDFPKSLTKARS
jgi:hypothetical protein